MNTSDLPAKLRRAMTEAGLVDPRNGTPSLSAWSRESGVHATTISNFTNGSKAKGSSVEKMARALDVSPADLYGMTGRGNASPWSPPVGTERLTPRQRSALNELIASFIEEQGESHDRQGEAEPRTEAGGQEHSGTGRGKDGGEAGQSGAAIGEVHELHPDQGQIQPTPSAEKSVALRTENRGKAKKREQDRHAED